MTMLTLLRCKTRLSRFGVLALALVGSADTALADRIVTKDGRIIPAKKARVEGAGYRFTFEHGEIVLPDKSLVREVEIEGDMSEYVPQNEDEKKKLADGYVKHSGKWLSAAAYKDELRRQFEAGKKRTEEIKAHSKWGTGWTKTTQHFIFETNTSPDLLDYYAELLEAYYDLQDSRIGIKPTPSLSRTKMKVNIFKSDDDFHENVAAEDVRNSPSTMGYFWSYDKTLNFFHDYEEPSRSTWVALHECTHLLTYLIDPQYRAQIWVNEAVADYFGSSKVYKGKNGKLVIEPGEVQTDRVLTVQEALRNEKEAGPATADGGKKKDKKFRGFTKLEDLFMLTREQFDGFQYAHAWSFVYFLMNAQDGKYEKGFNKFFKGLYTLEKGIESKPVGGDGKMVEPKFIRDYLLKRIGVKDTAALEAEWRQFIAAIPIEGPEARLKRGLYAVNMWEFEDAIPDLDAAIAGGVKDPRAWAYRARAKWLQGDFEAAITDQKKAIEMDPLHAGYRYSLSNVMAQWHAIQSAGPDTKRIKFGDGEKIKNDEAKVIAGLASELDPENDRFREWFETFE
ncbi:MAG: tetratricopeptide repeat protein [Planctomycetota bacterium]|mgnify:CR=1 FL=1|nr:tetratricopeptide repeat protein [Planctomycetota bacterium]